ncbi:putative polysaccharide biosynthesis protein [Ornithinibacillus sp. 179-J 7C1 HS]|uniref:putative polysaccharide biosynthesis protein n=1 Tax=Ornithinibacillus sp. 179-J 7C1 HS TaxID=3142384 RepID=UPI0039A05039
MESNKFVKGALILTLAGLISKILSAGYRIPLQNLTGDIGFYIYQQIYPIIGITLILALYGFPTAISKLTAEAEDISFKYFMLPIWAISFGLSSFFALLLYLSADEIAIFVGDKELASGYKIASILFLVIPFTALLRGVFQGKSDMKPTAYSQIGEQLFRVSIIIGIASLVAVHGLDIYWIGNMAGIAAIFGSVVAFVILVYFYVKNKPVKKVNRNIPWKYYSKTIVVYGFIAALSHMILLIIQFADSFTVVPGLMESGLTNQEAMEAKGVFDRGQPLIQIGAVLGSSFGLALIPSVIKGAVYPGESLAFDKIGSSLKISFYLAWAASLGLILLFPEVNRLLYEDNHGDIALMILMSAVLLSSITITSSSILQGLGFIKWTAVYIVLAFIMKWLLNIWFVPHFGIVGGAIGTVASLLFLTIATIIKLKQTSPHGKLLTVKWKPFLTATIGMVAFLLIADAILPTESFSRLALLFTVLLLSGIGAVIYIGLLIRFKAFSEKELHLIPFGAKFRRSNK